MVNNVIGVVNYVIAARPSLLNFMIADSLAKKNGVTEQELIEAITHLAFYAGWPKAMAAMAVAKKVFYSS